jgi:hypothetical protein
MNVYDETKNILIAEQNVLFANGDFVGVLKKFDELDTNIIENCPDDRRAFERFSYQQTLSQWNAFVPKFEFTESMAASVRTDFEFGIDEQCSKIGNYYYHFIMSEEQQRCLLEKIPVIRNFELLEASDGVYTWFVFRNKQGKPQFVAKKVLTIQEITTKHGQILGNVFDELDSVHLAGEFIKKGNNIEINFLSGTYMRDHFRRKEETEPGAAGRIHKDAIAFLNRSFRHRLVFTNQDPAITLITNKNILYTRENIKLLLECGASIRRFDTRGFCNKYDRRVSILRTAEVQHDNAINIWKKYGGDEPVFNYVPITDYVDVTIENLDPLEFPMTEDEAIIPLRKKTKLN